MRSFFRVSFSSSDAGEVFSFLSMTLVGIRLDRGIAHVLYAGMTNR